MDKTKLPALRADRIVIKKEKEDDDPVKRVKKEVSCVLCPIFYVFCVQFLTFLDKTC